MTWDDELERYANLGWQGEGGGGSVDRDIG
jgi:hypothetical protein